MTDEELGAEIWMRTNSGEPNVTMNTKIGRAARELLAKPVATREEVAKWVADAQYGKHTLTDLIFAAISLFTPPARPRMMIEGMVVSEIVAKMREGDPNETFAHCARVAHRLATTPAPEVDPDAEAKEWCWRHYCAACPNKDERHYQSAEHLWGHEGEHGRHGWRAVAAAKKEAGGE